MFRIPSHKHDIYHPLILLDFGLNISVEICDKSFTRSDALAKHLRTVHEIESGRPPDATGRAQPAPEQKAKGQRSQSLPENGEAQDELDNKSEGESEDSSSVHRYRYLKRCDGLLNETVLFGLLLKMLRLVNGETG
jgi:hypothetical protein